MVLAGGFSRWEPARQSPTRKDIKVKIKDKNVRGFQVMGESICRDCIKDDDFFGSDRPLPLMREPMSLSDERHRCKRCGKRMLRVFCYKEYRSNARQPVLTEGEAKAMI